MKYTKRFDEVRKDDVALAGGKGANLGELSHAGLPVPPGFVVTTAAYKAFVEAGGLEGETVGLASRPRADDPAAFEAAAEEIRDRGWKSVVIVSDPWHSLRARTMASDAGLDAWTSPTHSGPIVQTRQTQVRYILYETAALLYYHTTKASADGTEDVSADK